MGEGWVNVDTRTEAGSSYELRRSADGWDIVVDGHPVMSSGGPRLERAIVELALAPWGPRDDLTVLLAGLGMGLLLRALLDDAHVKRVVVVENVEAIVSWASGPLAELNGGALADRRVQLVHGELFEYLRDPDPTTRERPSGYSILVLD